MDAFRRNFGFSASDWVSNSSNYRVANDFQVESQESNREASASSFNVKSKLVSMWNNVKYGKTMFTLDSSSANVSGTSQVWILGQMYHKKMGHNRQFLTHDDQESESDADAASRAFINDFVSRIWLTYRRDLQEFQGTSIKTDCGWGCMIRSGQMMVANALLMQHLGRDWRWHQKDELVAAVAKDFHMGLITPWTLLCEWKGTCSVQEESSCTGETKTVSSTDLDAESKHRSIIRMFADSPSDSASPFSIHKLVAIAGDILDKKPGDWFGPASTSHLMKIARDRITSHQHHTLLSDFQIYVAQNTTIYRDDVIDLCSNPSLPVNGATSVESRSVELESFSLLTEENLFLVQEGQSEAARLERGIVNGVPHFSEDSLESQACPDHVINRETSPMKSSTHLYPSLSSVETPESPSSSSWTPVLILVPVRLGSGNRLNPIYNESLKTLLTEASCIGIIGGRPRHSLYFVGFQDDYLIHLDPHLVQDRVDVFRDSCSLDSFHCWSPRKMPLSKMDPSCCLGFLITSRLQFEAWCQIMPELVKPVNHSSSTGGQSYPMFSIVDGRVIDVENGSNELFGDLRRLDSVSSADHVSGDFNDVEDFVFL